MSSSYKRVNDPNFTRGRWSRPVKAAPRACSSPRFALDSVVDTYPTKYLRPERARRAAAGRPSTIPLSLLFPILVLLMISITLPQANSGQDLDAQLGVRLVGYSLAAVAVLVALGRRKLQLDFRIFAWALVPIFITLTALYSSEPLFSLTAGMTHLVVLFFAWRMVQRHGQPRAALALVMTGMIIGVLSIFVYYALPELGRSAAGTLVGDTGGRMRGVTAQPNSLGLISALTVLLAVMHFRALTVRQRLLAALAICVAAFCIVYSDSRTSILALVVCMGLWGLCRANAALNLFAIVGIALIACLLIGFVPDVTEQLTREGARSDDLSSFNGRWHIWTVAGEYIRENPVLGQGYGSSGWILPVDTRLFAAAVNAHNVYLELLFSGGAALLALYVIAVAISVIRSAKEGRAEALIALLFFLMVGVAESTPFGGLPLFPAAAFYTAVSLCIARSTPRTHRRSVLSPIASGQLVSADSRQRTLGLQL